MKGKKLCLIFTMLLINSCKAPHPPPDFTLCTVLSTGLAYCANNAIPDLKNGKEMAILPSDIVMPPESFKAFMDWGTDLRRDLIQCENRH